MTISPKKRHTCYKRDGFKCVKCGSTENLTVDHIIPVSQGGKNHLVNLQTMCKPCNVIKGAAVVLYRRDQQAVGYLRNRGFTDRNIFADMRESA